LIAEARSQQPVPVGADFQSKYPKPPYKFPILSMLDPYPTYN
jgi:hypothetical protein